MSEDKTDKVKIKAAESFEHDKQNISWLKKGKLLWVISYWFVFRYFSFFLKKKKKKHYRLEYGLKFLP